MQIMNRSLPVDRRTRESGFTLLEILLVVVIIGMLVTLAAVRLTGRLGQTYDVAARRQIDAFKSGIGLYELDNGFFPTTEQGLQALITQPTTPPAPLNWKGPYLDPPVLRQDPWHHNYYFKNPGTRNPSGYDLYSAGPNGVEGDDDDIGNWQ